MKFPREVSAERLIRVLEQLGYEVTRQKGSHVRLRHGASSGHVVTVPMHNPLKLGTLRGILLEVAQQRSVMVETIVRML